MKVVTHSLPVRISREFESTRIEKQFLAFAYRQALAVSLKSRRKRRATTVGPNCRDVKAMPQVTGG